MSQQIASLIDHTLLKPEASETDVLRICDEAKRYGFASVCVNPFWAPVCSTILNNSAVKVCTVIGFPLGANTSETKLDEAMRALDAGAHELDMVQNVGAFKSGLIATVEAEIHGICSLARDHGAIVKVILETCLLTDAEIADSCRIAARAGAAFVKTSTGFSSAGATRAHIALMRQTVGPDLGVKASGGVRTLASVQEMIAAGANRIGTSSGVAIIRELESGKTPDHPGTGY